MLFRYGCLNRKQVILQSCPYANTNLNTSQLGFFYIYTLEHFERIPSILCMPELIAQLWLAEADLSVSMTITHLQLTVISSGSPQRKLRGTEACDGGWCVLQVTWPVSSFTHHSEFSCSEKKKKKVHRKRESAGNIIRIRFYTGI